MTLLLLLFLLLSLYLFSLSLCLPPPFSPPRFFFLQVPLASPVTAVAFASDMVAVGQENGDLTLVDARFGDIISTIKVETDSPPKINSLCMRSDTLIAISSTNIIKIKFHSTAPQVIAKVLLFLAFSSLYRSLTPFLLVLPLAQ